MKTLNQASRLKKEVLIRLVQAFLTDNFEQKINDIPFDMRPKGSEIPFRCCIYKEREIIRERVIAGLGFEVGQDDEKTFLSEYAKKTIERENFKPSTMMTVLDTACTACSHSKIVVTELCKGCIAKACQSACKFNAIQIIDKKTVIDNSKCKKCKMCISACPYNAIAKISAPCEDVCPVDAIGKDEKGITKINFDKCILCGKCIASCPFAAVHERSQLIDILKEIKNKKKVIAMVAPAIVGQFPGTFFQLKSAIKQIGFYDVVEVAQGADVTIQNEAKEFEHKMNSGQPFMTSSCCSGYLRLVENTLPDLKPFVSDTKTPLYYTAEIVKEKYPDCVAVFISPCISKKYESCKNDKVNYALNFEELGAIFVAKQIDVLNCQPDTDNNENITPHARKFPIAGGVFKAVSNSVKNIEAKPVIINNLDKKNIALLSSFAKNKKCPTGNLVEVMCCQGGCINGNATISTTNSAIKKIEELVSKDESENS